MMWVKLLLLLMFLSYVSWVYVKQLDCISASAYQQGRLPLFTLFMFSQAMFLLPFMIEASTENTKCIAFLISIAIGFVGASPYYRSGMDKTVHKTACLIAMVLSVIWVGINHCEAYIGLVWLVACLVESKQWLLHLEVSLFMMIYFSIII